MRLVELKKFQSIKSHNLRPIKWPSKERENNKKTLTSWVIFNPLNIDILWNLNWTGERPNIILRKKTMEDISLLVT